MLQARDRPWLYFFDLVGTFSLYRETKAFVFRGEYIRKAET